jgi:hypothetical protein
MDRKVVHSPRPISFTLIKSGIFIKLLRPFSRGQAKIMIKTAVAKTLIKAAGSMIFQPNAINLS